MVLVVSDGADRTGSGVGMVVTSEVVGGRSPGGINGVRIGATILRIAFPFPLNDSKIFCLAST